MIKRIIIAIYKRLTLLSPHIEVLIRSLYWKNVKKLKSLNPNKTHKPVLTKHVDFGKIEDWLKAQGVKEGDLLIVHSSYDQLECTGLSPKEIIDRLLALIGPTGTLCMPVIRKFKGEPKPEEFLTTDMSTMVFNYKIRKTPIVSGLIPYYLTQYKDAVISHFPYNPLCALGPLAKEMMAQNLVGDFPSAHGENSCWKFCHDHDAKICFIGTSWGHHNTMIHIAEEAFGDWHWTDEEWYDKITFNIIDDKGTQTKVVHNRKAKWGMIHLAEMNLMNDLMKAHIVKDALIEDCVEVGFEKAKTLVDFLRRKNKKGYPYF